MKGSGARIFSFMENKGNADNSSVPSDKSKKVVQTQNHNGKTNAISLHDGDQCLSSKRSTAEN